MTDETLKNILSQVFNRLNWHDHRRIFRCCDDTITASMSLSLSDQIAAQKALDSALKDAVSNMDNHDKNHLKTIIREVK